MQQMLTLQMVVHKAWEFEIFLVHYPKGRHVVQACTTLDLTDKIPGVIQLCVMYYLTVLDHLSLLIFPAQRAMISNSAGHAGFGGSVVLRCLIVCTQVSAYAYLLI